MYLNTRDSVSLCRINCGYHLFHPLILPNVTPIFSLCNEEVKTEVSPEQQSTSTGKLTYSDLPPSQFFICCLYCGLAVPLFCIIFTPRSRLRKQLLYGTLPIVIAEIRMNKWLLMLLFRGGTCHTYKSLVKASQMVTLNLTGDRILPPQGEVMHRRAPQYLVNSNVIHHSLFPGHQMCNSLPFPNGKILFPPQGRQPKTPLQVLL